jgi:hypothetical protein
MSCCVKWASALVAVLMPALVPAQDRFFDSNGVRIRYIEQGSGQPVVLVHGFTSNIETGWINPGCSRTSRTAAGERWSLCFCLVATTNRRSTKCE